MQESDARGELLSADLSAARREAAAAGEDLARVEALARDRHREAEAARARLHALEGEVRKRSGMECDGVWEVGVHALKGGGRGGGVGVDEVWGCRRWRGR